MKSKSISILHSNVWKLAFCLLSYASTLQAATVPPDRPLAIGELLAIALENNPETSLMWWQAQRASAAVGNARSAFYPKFSLDANIAHGRDFRFTNGPDVNYTILTADVVMQFLVADFGERAANVEATLLALGAAGWQTEWTLQKVMAQVFEKSYATLYAQDTLEAYLLSLEDAKKMLDSATKLNQAGLKPISDVYSSKASLAQIQIDVIQHRSELRIQNAKLATTLGLDVDAVLQLAPIDALDVPQKSLLALIHLSKEQRRDLMAQRAEVAVAMANKKKVDAKYRPKITLNSRGGAEKALSDKRSKGAHYRVSLNLEVPIFTGFEDVYQKRMAYADIKISEEELAQLELEIALEVLTQSNSVEATREMLKFAKENLDNAQAAYDATLEKYNAGKERIAEVSIALRQIVHARVRYSEIHARYLTAIANLAFVTGSLNPSMEGRCINQ
ncbi:MAG: TolC family protein [Parachlamydiaceae bacterium]|nr:TolC family protein [Parachlamydiaceae bacterium]